MKFYSILLPTKDPSLYPTSSTSKVLLLIYVSTSPQTIVWKKIGRWKKPIKLWNNISKFTITTSRVTGLNFFCLWNLLSTILLVLLLISSCFFINKRYYPNIIVHLKHNIVFSYICNFAVNLNKLQSVLKSKISTAQQYY